MLWFLKCYVTPVHTLPRCMPQEQIFAIFDNIWAES